MTWSLSLLSRDHHGRIHAVEYSPIISTTGDCRGRKRYCFVSGNSRLSFARYRQCILATKLVGAKHLAHRRVGFLTTLLVVFNNMHSSSYFLIHYWSVIWKTPLANSNLIVSTDHCVAPLYRHKENLLDRPRRNICFWKIASESAEN